jgi:tetratricopeptide (TPR) repeat protein
LEIQPEALAAHNLANALFAKRQVDEAIVYYRKALELEPRAALIAYNLGNALSAKGQMDEAIEWYRKALEFQPNGPAIANTLGNALLTRGRVDDAIIYLSKAVELAPNLARAHNNLANALVRKGRLAEAIAHYDTTLNLQPTNVATLNNLSWILATCSDGAIRNGKRAVELAQRADELSGGNSPDVLVTLSAAYAEAGRFPEAIAAARRALNSPAVRSSTPATEAVQAKIKLYESQTPFRDASLNGRTKQPE